MLYHVMFHCFPKNALICESEHKHNLKKIPLRFYGYDCTHHQTEWKPTESQLQKSPRFRFSSMHIVIIVNLSIGWKFPFNDQVEPYLSIIITINN